MFPKHLASLLLKLIFYLSHACHAAEATVPMSKAAKPGPFSCWDVGICHLLPYPGFQRKENHNTQWVTRAPRLQQIRWWAPASQVKQRRCGPTLSLWYWNVQVSHLDPHPSGIGFVKQIYRLDVCFISAFRRLCQELILSWKDSFNKFSYDYFSLQFVSCDSWAPPHI